MAFYSLVVKKENHEGAEGMQIKLSEYKGCLSAGGNLEAQLDEAMLLASNLGFDALVYDYSPVPFDHDGLLITPEVLLRKTPAEWQELWCNEGYYQIDPVQQVALNSISPFLWSYQPEAETVLKEVIGLRHAPVVSYLQNAQMAHGVSVPIHLPKGGFASLAGLRSGGTQSALKDMRHVLGEFSLIAYALQEAAYPVLSQKEGQHSSTPLTKRERECMKWAAEGFTAIEIAARLHRSVATVTLHLNSAMHKLGARNRVQAVARAVHYRLLDS